MNIKTIFGMIGDTLTGIFGVLLGLVGVGIMSQIVFGSGWLGINVVGNISDLVNTFYRDRDWETKLPVLAGLPDVIVVIVVVSPTLGVSSNITSVLVAAELDRIAAAVSDISFLLI